MLQQLQQGIHNQLNKCNSFDCQIFQNKNLLMPVKQLINFYTQKKLIKNFIYSKKTHLMRQIACVCHKKLDYQTHYLQLMLHNNKIIQSFQLIKNYNRMIIMQQENSEPNLQANIDRIYSGLITDMVSFLPLTPKIVIKPQHIVENKSSQGKIDALKTRKSLGFLGKQYQNVYIPCVPAYEHSLKISLSNCEIPGPGNFFIKTKAQTNIKAIASGKRSAVYQSFSSQGEKILLRYKGCGNELKGFNKENNHDIDQTRGSHFFQTSKRELYMTTLLNKLFKDQLNIDPPANKPLYMFEYPEQFLKENEIANQLPMISKFCCVYETKGDRRAGTHLISPMEIIFLEIFQQINSQKWRKKFVDKGRIDEQNELIDFVTNFELFINEGDKFFDTYERSQEMNTYVTFQDGELRQKSENLTPVFQKIINQFVVKDYQEYCMQLLSSIKNLLKTIKIIIDRIGWQIGQIKRVMSKNGINWGFFQDHGKLFHCNAHLNNLIITKPVLTSQSSNYFVLPLDYDLAYYKSQFLNIEVQSPTYGQNDLNIFEGYLCAEYNAMQMSLFGVELMDFKYGIDNQQQKQKQEDEDKKFFHKMNRIIFRDTLVKSFIQGMRNKTQLKPKINDEWDLNIQDIEKLVEACLLISMSFQT